MPPPITSPALSARNAGETGGRLATVAGVTPPTYTCAERAVLETSEAAALSPGVTST